MPIYLRQSTASQEVPLGPFLDDTDGKTAETALTISNTDIKIWKSGATTLANKNSGGATHISNGIYYAVLDATDTNTLGPLVIFVAESGALPVRMECVVLAANVYDSLIGASDSLQVDATQIEGSDATNQIRDAVLDDATRFSGADIAAILTDTGTTLDGKLNTIDSNVDAILVDTAEIGVAGAGLTEAGGTGDHLTAVPWNAAWDAEVQSEVNDGLVAYDAATGTDVAAVETDTQDIQSRLPAALVSGRMSSDVVAISGSTTAADNLEASALGVITGQAQTGTLSTTQMTTDLTGYDNDRLIGRVIVFTSAPLAGEATDITDYASASGLVTFTAITEAPTNGTTFVIV